MIKPVLSVSAVLGMLAGAAVAAPAPMEQFIRSGAATKAMTGMMQMARGMGGDDQMKGMVRMMAMMGAMGGMGPGMMSGSTPSNRAPQQQTTR